jgi:hypothetical protein
MNARAGASRFREQLQSSLREFYEDSRRGGSSDRHAVENAVRRIYAELSLLPPKVIWCENFFQLINVPLLTVLIAGADHAVMPELIKVMRAHCANPSFERLLHKLAEETCQFEILDRSLGRSLKERLSKRFEDLSKEIVEWMGSDDTNRAESEFDWIVTYLNRQVDSVVHMIDLTRADRLFRDLTGLLTTLPIAVQETFFDDHRNTPVNMWGAWCNRRQDLFEPWLRLSPNNSGWSSPELIFRLMAYEIERNLAGAEVKHIRHWLDLFRGGFAFQFFENYCFICRYPLQIFVDNDLRLHNGEGPAIEFAGGERLYSWHGTFVPAHLIERRRRIMPWLIDREINAERRRVMLEIYGMDKYLRMSRARIIHQDQFGILYRKNYSRGEPLVVVAVTNASPEPDGTHRRYTLRVPPTMRTARQAVAWTFGVDAKTYAPQVES